ncbi:Uncharacterized protein TPAR_01965 [Tolypocladium paradoxum]|uniref:Uncharacterized protein n=1 Tax=Tolypocladium paradoxum TaxID=94208 RepID=A0A2S4L5W9_9HYPO|nr:Uncharacterized protein TPAR_01965 [Tolypocladium paradoxum]
MAKRKPTLSIQEMESALGYKVDPFGNVGHRFYSDLTPISDDTYDRTEMEYRNLKKAASSQHRGEDANALLPARDDTKTITGDGDSIIIRRSNFAGFYKFFIDINYGFGLDMPFLFTEAEACSALSVAQLRPGPAGNRTTFLNLPRELRDKIYGFTLHGGMWRTEERDYNFCRAIGDPSGFYFPFGDDCTLLRVNRQMRQEALPLAYRHTTFHLADIDDLTQLLIAVGRVGRENIESLDFSWESGIDLEDNWRKFPDCENNHLILPAWHVSACIQLLKQCRRLNSLHLKFTRHLITDVPKATFMSDPGISLLCSIRGIEELGIFGSDEEPLDEYSVAQWLRGQMAR